MLYSVVLLASCLSAFVAATPTGVLVGTTSSSPSKVCLATASVDSPASPFKPTSFAPEGTAVNVRYDSNTNKFYLPMFSGELYSSDDGVNWDLHWNQTAAGCTRFYDILFVPNSVVSFILCDDTGALFSQDSSKTFIPFTFGNKAPTYTVSGAFFNETIGVVLSSLYGAYARTEDGGRSWVQNSVHVPLGYTSASVSHAYSSTAGLYITGYLVKGQQVEKYFVYDVLQDATTYSDLYNDLYGGVSVDPTSGKGIGVPQFPSSSDGYVVTTHDGGKTWTKHTEVPVTSGQLNGAAMSPNGIGYVVGFDSLYAASSDYSSYTTVFDVEGCEVYQVAFSQ